MNASAEVILMERELDGILRPVGAAVVPEILTAVGLFVDSLDATDQAKRQ